MCELYSDLLQKNIKTKLYTDGRLKDISDLLKIDVTKKENQNPSINPYRNGYSIKSFFAENKKDEKFRKNCVQFYVTAACDLKDNFPFDKPILKYAK